MTIKKDAEYDYSQQAPDELSKARITRAIVVYFPLDRYDSFESELKWLYLSWIEMMKSESKTWRTDLVLLVDNKKKRLSTYRNLNELEKLGCSFENRRKSDQDRPMCTLIHCVAIKNRVYESNENDYVFEEPSALYKYLLDDVDIFSTNFTIFKPLYEELTRQLSSYQFLDSIVAPFEVYSYLKEANFNFALKTDSDVFLTPLFGKWLPKHCNDFYAGHGGYSREFNTKRLRRVANELGLEYASLSDVGSTWFGTPEQLRIVSYLTLFYMIYLSQEEFSPYEKDEKRIFHWPYWHYGVLSMYGSDLAINHFKVTRDFNVQLLQDYFDYPTSSADSVSKKLHLHAFIDTARFSKLNFKKGLYDHIDLSRLDLTQIRHYSLKLAVESRKMSLEKLYGLFNKKIAVKI